MRLEDDFEMEGKSEPEIKTPVVVLAAAAVVSFLMLVLVIVLVVNKDTIFPSKTHLGNSENDSEISSDFLEPESGGLVSSDLDIWEEFPNMSSEEKTVEVVSEEVSSEDDPSMGGTKTKIVYPNGREEWITINKYLPENPYVNANFSLGNGRLSYYEDGNKVSYTGIDLSKNNDYVDFNEVRRDGIDYVMLRMGNRGYSTGQITIDEYFYDNLKRAQDAGLQVGVTFFSQAITIEEAKEEALFVTEGLKDYQIKYPVSFEMEYIPNDNSRIDTLSKEEKTQIAKAFLEDVEAAGYIGVVSGNKEWMMAEINYAALSSFGVYLKEEGELPDFPYRFHLWKYTHAGRVNGVSGTVPISISMIDYSVK